jgi:hypothetical protein
MAGIARDGSNRAANAVWVHAHPGFKSPSLRPLSSGFLRHDSTGEPLLWYPAGSYP